MPSRLIRFNTSITVPQMTALEALAEKEGKHKAELMRTALDVFFEVKGVKVGGKERHAALLTKKRRGYKAARAVTATNKGLTQQKIS